jgi:hypothetical protein
MENSVIIRSQLVEAQITGTAPDTGKRYSFLEIPNLSRNNIYVYAIEAFGFAQLAATPNGLPIIGAGAGSNAVTSRVVVSLMDDKKDQFVYQMPYYSMIRANNGGFMIYLQPRIINLTNCFVQLTDVTDIAVGEVACFNLYYYLP